MNSQHVLSALEGISSALSMVENVHLNLSTFLMENSVKYQEQLTRLSEEKRTQLSAFAREITKIVKG